MLRDLAAARELYAQAKRARVELVIEANAADITHRRIAEVLNVSPGWVHRTLQRAKRAGA